MPIPARQWRQHDDVCAILREVEAEQLGVVTAAAVVILGEQSAVRGKHSDACIQLAVTGDSDIDAISRLAGEGVSQSLAIFGDGQSDAVAIGDGYFDGVCGLIGFGVFFWGGRCGLPPLRPVRLFPQRQFPFRQPLPDPPAPAQE